MKTVVISGGSDGLGKILARDLKADQYQVVITSANPEKLAAAAAELGVDSVHGDVSDYQHCVQVMQTVHQRYGRIDVVINNAGLWIEGTLAEHDPQQIKRVIEVNVLGPVFFTKAALPYLIQQGSGDVVNINSQAGFYTKPKRAVYNLTKWGLTGFSKTLQPELAAAGIRVSDIHPGKMATNLFKNAGVERDMSDAIDPSCVSQLIRMLLALPGDIIIPELGVKSIRH